MRKFRWDRAWVLAVGILCIVAFYTCKPKPVSKPKASLSVTACPSQPLNYPCDGSGNPTYTSYDLANIWIQQDSINVILRRIIGQAALVATACPSQPLNYPCDGSGNATYTIYDDAMIWVQQDTTIVLLRKLLAGGGGGGGGNIVDSIQKYAWLLNGNTITAGQYYGINNAQDWVFKINGNGFGFFVNGTGNGNMGWGVNALNEYYSSALTGSGNIGIGRASLHQETSGSFNTFMGYSSGSSMTNGNSCTAMGEGALAGLENGANYDYGMGFQPMGHTTTMGSASFNGAFGNYALYNILNGNDNVAAGDSAGLLLSNNSYCIAIGDKAGSNGFTGNNAMAVGYHTSYKGANTINWDTLWTDWYTTGFIHVQGKDAIVIPTQINNSASGTVVADGSQILELDNGAASTLTITPPASPYNGQLWEITTPNASITITVTGALNPPTILTNGNPARFYYSGHNTEWMNQ
jgi:hypothetical protein